MSDFNRMVFKYTIKQSNKIKKICEPLERFFGVNHFWYSRTTPEGGYFTIASNPEMHDYYHSSRLHLYSPFFRNPALIDPGLYYYRNIQDDQFLESIDTVSARLNVHLGAAFVIKKEDALIRFGYAIDPKRKLDIVHVMMNNFLLLKKFNTYFLQEIRDLLKNSEDDFIDLPAEMGDLYHLNPKGMEKAFSSLDKCQFLDRLGLIKKSDVDKLSVREMECLQFLWTGLTASQMGRKMNISKRTVETHLVSIKSKLNCFSKADLIEKAELLRISGFFQFI